jgi:hypothetical protein
MTQTNKKGKLFGETLAMRLMVILSNARLNIE